MKLQTVIAVLSCITLNILAQSDNKSFDWRSDTEWHNFKVKFNKNYNSSKLETQRRKTFKENIQKIIAHNTKAANGEASFRLAPNHLLDRTRKEYKALLGTKVPKAALRQRLDLGAPTTRKPTGVSTQKSAKKAAVLPLKVDYRTSACTPPVRDQGNCGSCWAFSATYETEFFNCKNRGVLSQLSEQNLVDCDPMSFGCDGGWYDYAWQYTIDAKGQCSAFSYPYKAFNGTCFRSFCRPSGKVSSYKFIPNNAQAIMEAIATVGPVSAVLDASLDSFAFYSHGIYADNACTNDTNHAVNLVGYGTAANGVPYWIVRNSWTKDWGVNGYGFIKRGVNMCGIEDWTAYPIY